MVFLLQFLHLWHIKEVVLILTGNQVHMSIVQFLQKMIKHYLQQILELILFTGTLSTMKELKAQFVKKINVLRWQDLDQDIQQKENQIKNYCISQASLIHLSEFCHIKKESYSCYLHIGFQIIHQTTHPKLCTEIIQYLWRIEEIIS